MHLLDGVISQGSLSGNVRSQQLNLIFQGLGDFELRFSSGISFCFNGMQKFVFYCLNVSALLLDQLLSVDLLLLNQLLDSDDIILKSVETTEEVVLDLLKLLLDGLQSGLRNLQLLESFVLYSNVNRVQLLSDLDDSFALIGQVGS